LHFEIITWRVTQCTSWCPLCTTPTRPGPLPFLLLPGKEASMFALSLPVAIIWVGIATALAVGLTVAIRTYLTYLKEVLYGRENFHLNKCSRWPERADCGQDCLAQIEADPKGCMAWTLMAEWFQDKTCVYCQRPFHEVHWHDRPPALLGPDKKTAQWNEIPAEKLPEVLKTHQPVCWSCHMAETFRREHPDLVVDRPGHRGPMNEYLTKS